MNKTQEVILGYMKTLFSMSDGEDMLKSSLSLVRESEKGFYIDALLSHGIKVDGDTITAVPIPVVTKRNESNHDRPTHVTKRNETNKILCLCGCGLEVTKSKTGRTAKFATTACRVRHHRRNRK